MSQPASIKPLTRFAVLASVLALAVAGCGVSAPGSTSFPSDSAKSADPTVAPRHVEHSSLDTEPMTIDYLSKNAEGRSGPWDGSGRERTRKAARRGYRLLWPKARWNPCRAITYRINTKNSPSRAVKDAREAFRRTSARTGIRFRYLGRTKALPGTRYGGRAVRNGRRVWKHGKSDIVVGFASRNGWFRGAGPSVLGVATSGWVGLPGPDARETGLVVIHAKNARKIPAGFGKGHRYGWQGTRGQLYMHEIGHVIGLGHVNSRSQIMNSFTVRKKARWGWGDKRGLRKLGRGQGCIRGY